MFKGTGALAASEFSRTVARNGGRDNAFTGFDMTGYHQTIASDRLELVMRMEADRMVNLRILEKELRPERQVVLEERRMRVDNVPSAMLDEAAREQLFGLHKPYAMPTAGYADDVKKLGVGDLTAFYRRFYAPNNAVLIVAGDTTTEAVRKLAEKHYGPIPRRPVDARHRPAEGGAGLPQRVIRADVRVPEPRWNRDFLAPSYRVGETRHAHALLVLTRLFGGSETSRLSRALGGAGQDRPVGDVGLRPHGSWPHELRDCRPAGARAQRRGGRDGGRRSDEEGPRRRRHGGRGRAGTEPASGERDLFAGLARERHASLRQCALHGRQHRRARQLAAGDRRGSAERRRGRGAPCLARRACGHVAAHAGRGLEMTVLRWMALALGLALVASRAEAIEIKEVTTPLGIKAWLVEDSSTPVVALSFSFASGSSSDPENGQGLTSLTASLLTDGAGPLDAQAFKQRQEDASVGLGFGASLENVSGSLRLLSAHRDEAFELLRLAVTAPRFDPDRIEQRRSQISSG